MCKLFCKGAFYMKKIPDCKVNSLLTWSLGHFWCNEYEEAFSENATINFALSRARLIDHFGFDLTGIKTDMLDLLSDTELEELALFLNEKDITFHPILEAFNFASVTLDEAKAFADEYASTLAKHDKLYRSKTITCNLASGTRFEHEFDLDEKLDIIARNLAVVVEKCQSLGYRFAIENAGDFYTSEIVRLCQTIPGLLMVFDIANSYLIGEDSMQAFYISAPYTAVVHFRDVKVCPEPHNQIIRLRYAPLGEGDVELEKGLEIILANCPDPMSLIFETEIINDGTYTVWESLEKEINFINTIQG